MNKLINDIVKDKKTRSFRPGFLNSNHHPKRHPSLFLCFFEYAGTSKGRKDAPTWKDCLEYDDQRQASKIDHSCLAVLFDDSLRYGNGRSSSLDFYMNLSNERATTENVLHRSLQDTLFLPL